MTSDSLIIKQFFKEHPKDAARALGELEPEKLAVFLNDTAHDLLLDIVPAMDPHFMAGVYEGMNPEILVQLLESMELQHAVLAIRMMPDDLAEKILNLLSEKMLVSVKRLLHFFENSVGSHMDPAVFTLQENQTLKEALTEIKKHKGKVQPQIFVLSSERKLKGSLTLTKLIAGSPDTLVRSIMDHKFSALSPETPVHSVLTHPGWADYYAMPVVDNRTFFLGAIKLENIRAVSVKSAIQWEGAGQATVNALGELYRLGLSGLLRSATDLHTLSEK